MSTCPVCGSAGARPVAQSNQLGVVQCQSCGHGYVWPMPSDDFLDRLYQEAYYHGGRGSIGFTDYDALAPARRRMFRRHLDLIEAGTAKGRVLDVGCATGDFLKAARDRGWEGLGVDPSPAGRIALEAGIAMVGRSIDDAAIEPGSLQLVTFWDVLEHLKDPIGSLRRAKGLLRAGGAVAVTVPEAGNLVARLSGRRWFGYKTAGEHLQFFTPASLRRAFSAAGLQVEIRRPVAWSCTVGYAGNRAGLYLGRAGRVARRVLGARRIAGLVIDLPQINQFALGRAGSTPAPAEG